MPIYEYRCTRCARSFELIRSHDNADDPAPCVACAAPASRQISACARLSRSASGTPASRGCGSCAGRNCASCR